MNWTAARAPWKAGVAALALALVTALPGTAGAGERVTSGAIRPMTAVPAGFVANSITWLSPEHGWILGVEPCGKAKCTEVVSTTDGGGVWRTLGSIDAPVPNTSSADPGVTEVRFATPELGFAFTPDLYETHTGGRTWTAATIPGGGHQVLALATSSAGAFAVVSPCAVHKLCSKPLTFWRTTNGRSWIESSLDLPTSLDADVSAFGQTVYVLDSRNGEVDSQPKVDHLYASTDGGVKFAARPDPCDVSEYLFLTSVDASSATDVALLCYGNPGFSESLKTAYRSTDTGLVDRAAGTLGYPGLGGQIALSPAGDLAVASVSDGSFIYVNDTHSTTWTLVIGYSDGGAGWNDLTYVSGSEAWIVYAPADGFGDVGKVLVTHDAGLVWSAAAL